VRREKRIRDITIIRKGIKIRKSRGYRGVGHCPTDVEKRVLGNLQLSVAGIRP